MPYCQIADPFAEVYANNQLLVRLTDPPIDYSINQFVYSQTLTWDNQSVTKYSPETITYSVQDIPGLPYSLSWNSGSHILNNPSNYSYSFEYDLTCKFYHIDRQLIERDFLFNCNPITINTQTFTPTWARVATSLRKPSLERLRNFSRFLCSGQVSTFNDVLRVTHFTNSTCTTTTVNNYTINSDNTRCVYNTRIIDATTNQEAPKKIIIRDGSSNYEYPINDINSVIVNYSVASKNIIVNGTSYNLINENSITLTETQKYRLTINSQSQEIKQDYNSPPSVDVVCGESCPPDTCKVECSDHYCCYNSLGNVVKVFPK